MSEAAPTTVGVEEVPAKTAASGVSSLLRETGWLVESSQALLFILLVFYFSFSVFSPLNVFALFVLSKYTFGGYIEYTDQFFIFFQIYFEGKNNIFHKT